jgi:hypothetical protein
LNLQCAIYQTVNTVCALLTVSALASAEDQRWHQQNITVQGIQLLTLYGATFLE